MCQSAADCATSRIVDRAAVVLTAAPVARSSVAEAAIDEPPTTTSCPKPTAWRQMRFSTVPNPCSRNTGPIFVPSLPTKRARPTTFSADALPPAATGTGRACAASG